MEGTHGESNDVCVFGLMMTKEPLVNVAWYTLDQGFNFIPGGKQQLLLEIEMKWKSYQEP